MCLRQTLIDTILVQLKLRRRKLLLRHRFIYLFFLFVHFICFILALITLSASNRCFCFCGRLLWSSCKCDLFYLLIIFFRKCASVSVCVESTVLQTTDTHPTYNGLSQLIFYFLISTTRKIERNISIVNPITKFNAKNK